MNRFILISNGNIDFNRLIENEVDINKLFKYLKKKKIHHIEDIKLLLCFNNIFLAFSINPIPIIINGKIMKYNLFKIKKSKIWLNKILLNRNLNLNEIIYAILLNNKLYIIKEK